jgi:hypothetical protein
MIESQLSQYQSCLFRETYNDSFSIQSNKYSKGTITEGIKLVNSTIKFDGISGKITRKFKSKDIKTIVLVINPISLTKDLLKLSSTANIKLVSGVVTLTGITGGIITIDSVSNNNVVSGKFQKIVVTTPTSIVVNDIQEGFITGYYDGYFDLFELYNVQYFGQ